jgi:hypothetical protein
VDDVFVDVVCLCETGEIQSLDYADDLDLGGDIMQLCRALMKYGAPTHRLEEYMMMTSNVLDIKA